MELSEQKRDTELELKSGRDIGMDVGASKLTQTHAVLDSIAENKSMLRTPFSKTPDAIALNQSTTHTAHRNHQRSTRHIRSPLTSPPQTLLHESPKSLLTASRTRFSNSGLRSRHIFAASTFAGLSSFGSANMLITLIKIFSTDWIGLHRSEACS